MSVNGRETFRFAADLADASSPILVEDSDGEFDGTPFQTASAGHDDEEAGKMLCAWLNLAEEGDEIEVKKVDDEADDKDDEEEEEEDEEEDDEHEDKWERDTTCGMEENPGVFDTGNGALKYYDVNPNYPGIVRVTVESY